MFGRGSRKKATLVLSLQDGDANLLYQGPLRHFSPPEDVILQMSLEYYNDPAPCQIHRGAVISRAQAEIQQEAGVGEYRSLDVLPPHIRRYWGGYPSAERMILREETP